MKVAIIGASGKTGMALVRESLRRGYEVAAVCRTSSADRMKEFTGNEACTVFTAPVVSHAEVLTRALAGCDAAVALLISVKQLKATDLVRSLAEAGAANGVKRMVFTAGEMTAVLGEGEVFTLRQRILSRVFGVLSKLTAFSMSDMIESSVLVRRQKDWDWTILRAPTLTDKPAAGYRLCKINEVTGKHALSRADYASSLLDSLGNAEHHRRSLTVVQAV